MQDEIRGYFEIEAKELIDRLTRGAASLHPGAPEDEATLKDLLRAAHTLKGASHVVGEPHLATLAHDFEDKAATYRQSPSSATAATLLAGADAIAAELARSSTPEPAQQLTEPAPAASRTVRVDIAETARLLTHLGESGALVASMRVVLERLEGIDGTGSQETRSQLRSQLRTQLADELDRLERNMRDMHRTASQLRLGSAEILLLEAGRIVRATATATGKPASVQLSGADERIDVLILEAFSDAMLHLVRNAFAHAIESRAERLAAGKPASATITITLQRSGTNIVFRCADDGRGISLEILRQAAIQQRLLSAADATSVQPEALYALLLKPGFSLSSRVDQISGRGVGLDAVREAAQSIGGTVAIASIPGRGTTFTLTAPQSLFAVSAIEVFANGVRYAIPVSAVEQTFRMDPHHMGQVWGNGSLMMGSTTMSFLWLYDAFPAPALPPPVSASSTCVILKSAGHRFALGVDRVDTLTDLLVHPLPHYVQAAPYIAGATIGADGTPHLVLDPEALASFANRTVGTPRADRPAAAAPLPILIIDDSLTTRMLEQSILESEGYTVELASSAEEGLVKAKASKHALFLVDVEMPGMNGFDFVRTTKADPNLRDTPAIMVTSLDSREYRDRGREAGAASYIVKGEFNQQIYLDRIRKIAGAAGGKVPAR